MQAERPLEALAMIQQILDSSSPDLEDHQTLYAVLVTAGLAGLASEDLSVAERSFRRAAELLPDAPQVHWLASLSYVCTIHTALAEYIIRSSTRRYFRLNNSCKQSNNTAKTARLIVRRKVFEGRAGGDVS